MDANAIKKALQRLTKGTGARRFSSLEKPEQTHYGSFRNIKNSEELNEIILNESAETANRVLASTMLFLSLGLLANYILEKTGATGYDYTIYEAQWLVCAMTCYAVPVPVAFFCGRYQRRWHRILLIGAMMLAGTFSYAAFNMMGRTFVLLPLVMVTGYCNIKICNRTLIGTSVSTAAGILLSYWTDINGSNSMGYTWSFREIMLDSALPMVLFVIILYFAARFVTRGRIEATERMIDVVMVSERRDAELETAMSVQGEIFKHPRDLSQYGNIDIAGDIIPAHEVAGDFYDYFITPTGKLVIAVGDVLDKGITAAMFMVGARNSLRSLFEMTDDMAKVFRVANNICCDTSAEALVSVFVAVIDPKTGRGEYINAGHTPPIILHADGTAGFIESDPQLTIGTFEDVDYEPRPLFLEKGDTVLLYTDGISEAVNRDGLEYDMTRPAELIRKMGKDVDARTVCDAIYDDVEAFSDTTRRAADDRTMLVVRWGNETPDIRTGTWHLVMGLHNTANTAGAMEVVNQTLEKAGSPDELRRSVDCAVDDLLSNIMDYSGAGSIHMTVRATDRFCRVSITDDGSPFDPYRYANLNRDLLSEGGRGIELVRALMDETAYCYNRRNINTVTKYH